MKYQPLAIGLLGLVIVIALSSCGASQSASPMVSDGATPSIVVTPAAHNYIYRLSGTGITVSGAVYVNFGAPTQGVQNMVGYTLPAGTTDLYATGNNTVADFAYNNGAGTLTVVLYRDGIPIQSKTAASAGMSIHFDYDI